MRNEFLNFLIFNTNFIKNTWPTSAKKSYIFLNSVRYSVVIISNVQLHSELLGRRFWLGSYSVREERVYACQPFFKKKKKSIHSSGPT